MAKLKHKYFHLVNLGCSKNAVDSASMAQLLEREGYRASADPRQAEVLIVNTCGFIGPARQESVNALNELAAVKRPGQLLVAAGCMSQRYGAEMLKWVPGLDGLIGARRWMDIVDFVQRVRARPHPEPLYHLPGEAAVVGSDERGALRAAVQGASAYLKIADGCRRPCAFCAIPLIKGTAVSRPLSAILDEARRLEAQGVREVVVVPIGFVCDHVEVLYDLDHEAAATARELGMTMRRAGTVEEAPLFIQCLAAAVRETIRNS